MVTDPAGVAFGVLYEITPEQLAHVELTEGVLIGNYHRVKMRAESLAAPTFATTAASVPSDRRDPALVPKIGRASCRERV